VAEQMKNFPERLSAEPSMHTLAQPEASKFSINARLTVKMMTVPAKI